MDVKILNQRRLENFMHIKYLLSKIEKDIKQPFFIDNWKLTRIDGEIKLLFLGYDERMEDIVQYCKQLLETELGKTFILHHSQSGKKPLSKENTYLYRFAEE